MTCRGRYRENLVDVRPVDACMISQGQRSQYAVWLIAADSEWDPPLFEVWANGEKKIDVRIPRARFVYMQPFYGCGSVKWSAA